MLRNAIENTVSISQFNRGLAGKIFEEVKQSGPKLVMKNNSPECILMSPEEYLSLLDELADIRLLAMATNRMSDYNSSDLISQDEVDLKMGFTEDSLENAEKVEFE